MEIQSCAKRKKPQKNNSTVTIRYVTLNNNKFIVINYTRYSGHFTCYYYIHNYNCLVIRMNAAIIIELFLYVKQIKYKYTNNVLLLIRFRFWVKQFIVFEKNVYAF